MSQTVLMPKKPKVSTDRHKPFRWVRVRPVLADPAQKAADANAKKFTEYVNDALREKLERDGFWPPAKQ